MATIQLLFLVLALACLILATFNVPSRWNLIAGGLAFYMATLIPGLLR